MADRSHPPDRSGVLHTEDDAPYVIEQTVVGADNVKGGGEWPDPDARPEAPAPGSDPAEADAIAADRSRRRADHVVRQDGADKRPEHVARAADTHDGLAGE